MKDYFVNEGNRIGGQEAQALGTAQTKITASVAVTKGDPVEATASFKVGPADADSTSYVGIAANDAAKDAEVVVETEGFVKFTASGAIGFGEDVVCAGSGKVKTKGVSTGTVIGRCFNAAADGKVAYVKLK